MHRIFVEPKEIQNNKIIIKGETFHHLKNVLRIKTNDEFIACDGLQNDYLMSVEKISSQEIIGTIIKKITNLNEPKIKITLAQSLLKKNKFDLIVDFSVQLGV
jgi:16S rRNA (uracil1498-N3)-methyltransferase